MNQGFIPPPVPTQPQHSQVNYNPPGRRRRSMLAWWAALPLIPFAVLESLYGWQIALARATSPDFAVSYFAGAIFGALLIPLVVAYIVYRATSRSQWFSSLAFTFVLLLLTVGVYREGRLSGGHIVGAADSTASNIHTFSQFEFETAGGWKQIEGKQEKTVAALIFGGQSRSDPVGMIRVDVGTPTVDLRQSAENFAAADGRILPDPVLVDSVQGLRVETTSTDPSRPKFAVLLPRNGRLYLIIAAATNGYDVTPDFDRVLKTWKWKD
jgi:hypothetical protein